MPSKVIKGRVVQHFTSDGKALSQVFEPSDEVGEWKKNGSSFIGHPGSHEHMELDMLQPGKIQVYEDYIKELETKLQEVLKILQTRH